MNKRFDLLSLEIFALELVHSIEVGTSPNFFKSLVNFKDEKSQVKVKKLLEQRLNSLALLEGLLKDPLIQGSLKPENWWYKTRKFYHFRIKEPHWPSYIFNNTLIITLGGYFIYIPNNNYLKLTYFNEEIIKAFKEKGIDFVFPIIKSEYKLVIRDQTINERIFIVMNKGIKIIYLYFILNGSYSLGSWGYDNFKTDSVEIDVYNREYILKSTTKDSWVYKNWHDEYQEKENRTVNIVFFPGDKMAWEQYLLQSIYAIWSYDFRKEFNRIPDLSKEFDQKQWLEFLKNN